MRSSVPLLFLGDAARASAWERAHKLLGAPPEGHPDLREVAPDGETLIGIDDVRQVLLWTRYAPTQASQKVVVIGPGERLSREATSAMLKSLEEAPNYMAYLLHARGPEHVLDTIRSRCIARWTAPAWVARLDERGLEGDERALLLELLEQEGEHALAVLDDERSPLDQWEEHLAELSSLPFVELADQWSGVADNPLRARAVVWTTARGLIDAALTDIVYLAKLVASEGRASCQRFLHHLLVFLRRTGWCVPGWASKISLSRGELDGNANAQLLMEVILLWPRRR